MEKLNVPLEAGWHDVENKAPYIAHHWCLQQFSDDCWGSLLGLFVVQDVISIMLVMVHYWHQFIKGRYEHFQTLHCIVMTITEPISSFSFYMDYILNNYLS